MKKFVFTEQSILAFIENLTDEKIKMSNFSDSKNYIQIEFEDFIIFLTSNKKDKNIDTIPFIIIDCIDELFTQKTENIQDLFLLCIEQYRKSCSTKVRISNPHL